MSEQRHVIKRQVIELTVQRPEDAQAYQDVLSRIYRQRILPWMEYHLNKISDPERLDRIDTLELDIGALNPELLEEDFVSRLEALLSTELSSQINPQAEASEEAGTRSSPHASLELFAFFVSTGNLPWWADASRPTILVENLAELLDTSPQALRSLLPELLRERDQRLRLINNYSDEQLKSLCALLLPAYASDIGQDFTWLFGELQNIQLEVRGKPALLRKALWNTILWVAGMGGQRYASLADFYQAVVRRLDPELIRMLLAGLRRLVLPGRGDAEPGRMLLGKLDQAFLEVGISVDFGNEIGDEAAAGSFITRSASRWPTPCEQPHSAADRP